MTKLNDDQVKNLLSKSRNPADKVREEDVDKYQISLDEIESFGDAESIQEMEDAIESYRRMLQEKITFINPVLTKAIPFTRENLYTICAYTGSGKSTIAANISYALWQEQKKVLIISNEESKADVLFRIGCLYYGYNFNDYKKDMMPDALITQVKALFPDIAKYVKIIDVNYKDAFTQKLEAVISALESVKKDGGFSCALIDYYQLISKSIKDPSRKKYDVLDELRQYLGQYIKSSDIPIVLFAQLHSFGKRSNPDLDSRIKDCPGIVEPSTVIIEAIPDFENNVTDFRIAKDRFGLQGHRIPCGFDKGRFVPCDEKWEQKQQDKKLKQLEEMAYGLEEPGEDSEEDAAQLPAVSSSEPEPEQQ